eukprot:gnl/TRDRNA2_/TRDRNA2_169931_c0_seq4.p1 gnl/TRDRNA2_/TRDRNA2_169931_c0~~gnl/TRDRNA2_/TRDRNA2_169931_c0_seq4.p1  ORF type:complete len:306 (+),score=38.64 gnl/TRDRNA2_/TRDRNA2_169931_c0_seq4:106-918(+)
MPVHGVIRSDQARPSSESSEEREVSPEGKIMTIRAGKLVRREGFKHQANASIELTRGRHAIKTDRRDATDANEAQKVLKSKSEKSTEQEKTLQQEVQAVKPVDCQWDTWGDWDDCTTTCGGGKVTRSRGYKVEAQYDGKECDGDKEESKECNDHRCPVNCEFEQWSEWSDCSVKCGARGRKQHTRAILVNAEFGGTQCKGPLSETEACDIPCPVDCKWQPWGEWGDCDKSCGGGNQGRSRVPLHEAEFGGKACHDKDARESKGCGDGACP